MNKGMIKTVLLFCVLVLCIGIAIALATDMGEEGKEGEVGSHTHDEYVEKTGGTLIGDIYAPNLYVGGVIHGIGSDITDLNATKITNGTIDIARLPSNINADTLDGLDSTYFALIVHNHDSRYYNKTESDGKYALIIHTHPPGDADTLDGLDSTVFAMAAHNHDNRYYTKTEGDSRYLNLLGGTLSGDLYLPSLYASGVISGDGSGLTNLNANNIATGTMDNARLPSNINADKVDGYDFNATEIKPFGTWTPAIVGSSTQASTDLLLVGYIEEQGVGNQADVNIKTDSSNPPSIIRYYHAHATGSGHQQYHGFCVPVKKNDYYLITQTIGTVTAFEISLGS